MGRRGKYWFCRDCHAWHSEDECPNAARHYIPGPITNYNNAVDYIEWRLAQSYGGGETLPTTQWVGGCVRRDLALAALAASIVEFAESTMWGGKLRERYLSHPELAPYILYIEHPDEIPPDGVNVFEETHYPELKISPAKSSDPNFVLATPGTGHNQSGELTPEQKELVWQHYPKIKKEAKKRSFGDPTLLDDLLTVGMERAIQLVREWSADRRVTFGKYIEKHLWGAMRDHAKGARKFTSGLYADQIDRLHFGRVSPRTPTASNLDDTDSKKRWSKADRRTGDFFRGERVYSARTRDGQRKLLSEVAKRHREAGGTIQRPDAPTPLTPEILAAARLNKRQAMVYQECVDKNTPIDVMARRIGILEGKTVDVTQISRIKRQAIRRVRAAQAALGKSVK